MNFALSEQQEMLRKSARDFLAEKCPKAYVKQMESDEKGYSAALWQEMAKLGWLGLPLPELYAVSGWSSSTCGITGRNGRVCLPGRFSHLQYWGQ